MQRTPVSMRVDDLTLSLLDAWAEHLSLKRHSVVTRSAVLTLAVARLAPPDDLGETARAVRDAHKALTEARKL